MKARENIDPDQLGRRLEALPGVSALREAAAESDAYLVGGAVRDLLLGHDRADLDVVVEGDVVALARALGGGAGELLEHERFRTAVVELEGLRIDLATSRAEIYDHPGALPKVDPAPLTQDLARRDFTINAMAVPLASEPNLIDPHGGLDDLRAGRLRVLHEGSFRDDPTRALRAVRYAARLEFELDSDTERLLRGADLGTVSADRVEAELRRIAAEPAAARALELAAEWELLELAEDRLPLVDRLLRLLEGEGWQGFADRVESVLLLLAAGPGTVPHRLAGEEPDSLSAAASLARDQVPEVIAVARILGADWLDDYVERGRRVSLEIDGADLLEAGIPEGPAVGRGLDAALDAKLDGEISGRDAELELALKAARAGE